MGYFYSLGINFDDKDFALNCTSLLEKFHIQLSDSSTVNFHLSIYESTVNQYITFTVALFPDGVQYPIRGKNSSKPYFYEIREQLYRFLLSLKLPFNHALYEFEGADNFLDCEVSEEINKYGIGEIQNGDPNAASLFGMKPTYYESKRYLDGLIISEKIYNEIKTDRDHFTVFKDGYFWLSILHTIS